MKRIIGTPKQLAERAAQRGGQKYIDALQPAYIETLADGRLVYDGDHPAWRAAAASRPRPPRISAPDVWKTRGPRLWGELHARANAYQGDAEREKAWLDRFAMQVTCGECRTHWLEMMARTPPDLTSAAAYYQWTVDRHNEVNVRLGKPVWISGSQPS